MAASTDRAADDSLYPIAVLIDELKNEDIQVSNWFVRVNTFYSRSWKVICNVNHFPLPGTRYRHTTCVRNYWQVRYITLDFWLALTFSSNDLINLLLFDLIQWLHERELFLVIHRLRSNQFCDCFCRVCVSSSFYYLFRFLIWNLFFIVLISLLLSYSYVSTRSRNCRQSLWH